MKKDHDNPYDDEAIAVYGQHGNKIGYVANSVHTVCRGTGSAGFVYGCFEEETECIVRFIAADYGFAIGQLFSNSDNNDICVGEDERGT